MVAVVSKATIFPLSVHSGGRYLVDRLGAPLFVHGDSIWEAPVRATLAQWTQILDDRKSRGFNAILIELIEHRFNSAPTYRNVNGDDPFTTMSPVAWNSPTAAYWNFVESLVAAAESRGMLLVIFPAFYGFSTGVQGWDQELASANAADLQTYGDYLGQRFGNRNVLWVKGGDNDMDATSRAKQENIFTGITGRDPGALLTAETDQNLHTVASQVWGTSAINVNSTYDYSGSLVSAGATAYAVSPTRPFFLIEARYENESVTLLNMRQSYWTNWLAGGCGDCIGVNPLWSLGDPNAGGNIGAAAAISGYLGSPGTLHRAVMATLVNAVSWWLLAPSTGTALVTGGGSSTVAPALASDGSFAAVWKNNASSITFDMTAITHGSVRIRRMDPTTGGFTTVGTFANTGTQTVTHPGNNAAGDPDWVFVLD